MAFEFPAHIQDWTLEVIKEAVQTSEWTQFEVKQQFAERLAEVICAFSNAHGGWLVVGVSKTGEFLGVERDEPSHLDHHRHQIQPAVGGDTPRFLRLDNGRFICVAWIPEGGMKPYQNSEGRHFIRDGGTNRVMTPAELADAFLRKEDIRQRGRLLLMELVHARDVHLWTKSMANDARSAFRFTKLDAGLLGQLVVAVAPLLAGHVDLLEALQRAKWAVEEYNAAVERAQGFLVAHQFDLDASLSPRSQDAFKGAHISQLAAFFNQVAHRLSGMGDENAIRRIANVLGEPEPKFRSAEQLFMSATI